MIDFRALCRKYHIRYAEGGEDHHVSGNGWIGVSCPWCAGGKSGYHLGFSTESGAFNCWRCGALRFWDVIPTLLRVSRSEAGAIVGEFQTHRKVAERKVTLRRRVLTPPPGASELLPAHKRYLEGRKYDVEALIANWGLLGTGGMSGKWSWRVIIPVCDGDDRIVAYQGRAIGDVKPKYKMTDDEDCLADPKGFVYGIHKVPGDTVLIVEGVPGVWRMGPGAVATFGIGWKKEQLSKLRRFRRRFVMFDDGEGETLAQRRAKQLASALSLFPGETEILSGFSCDPGDLSDHRAEKIRRVIGL